MNSPYYWRKLSDDQKKEVFASRLSQRRAWHGPPHVYIEGHVLIHLTAACYEHTPHIGRSPQRMDEFSKSLLRVFSETKSQVAAWCVLPNHYHALVETADMARLLREMGRFHGRTSLIWNKEELTKGRQNFHRAVERLIRSDRHYWATMNYVHHNPVRHGYASKWSEWPWGSAPEFLARTPRERVEALWKSYPVLDYGEEWDAPEL